MLSVIILWTEARLVELHSRTYLASRSSLDNVSPHSGLRLALRPAFVHRSSLPAVRATRHEKDAEEAEPSRLRRSPLFFRVCQFSSCLASSHSLIDKVAFDILHRLGTGFFFASRYSSYQQP